jgi:hypothetical protein
MSGNESSDQKENHINPGPQPTLSKEHSSVAGGSVGPRNPETLAPRPRSGAPVLAEQVLARFASRAAAYDRENRFFAEDFEELRAAQYLLLPLPSEFGGAGMTLAEVSKHP